MIVGIDEVGRGPWAGPLVIGAVVLGDGSAIEGLTDSKKISAKKRTQLDEIIRDQALGVGLGWVHSREIDEVGISKALELGTIRALSQIEVPYHQIIIDGTVNFLRNTGKGPYVTTMKKADLLIASVSAASIVAKVARDNWMIRQDDEYPKYGFKSNVGYGTAVHMEALNKYGPTLIHRRSFAPVAAVLGRSKLSNKNKDTKVTARSIGSAAEAVAASELNRNGYEIIAQNWKTKWCEIDIVASKNNCIYFVEVKHRKDSRAGGGLAAITPKKLKQMTFAARLYQQKLHLKQDMQLMVITTTGASADFESLLLVD